MPRAKPHPKPPAYRDMTLDDVRSLVQEVREEGLRIQSHYKRLEQEYSDWEDRVNELDKIISQAEEDTGLTKKQIMTSPNAFDQLTDELSENGREFDPFK